MRSKEVEETYNIHKIINCIIPSFKSKFLCRKGIHNYMIHPISIEDWNWKCMCCGEEIESSEK